MKLLLRTTAMLAFLFLVLAGHSNSVVDAVDASSSTQIVDEEFDFRVTLSNQERVMMIDLSGGEANRLAGVEVHVSYLYAGNIVSFTTVKMLHLDAMGSTSWVLPIEYQPSLTNFEIEMSAFYFATTGDLHFSPMDWKLGSLHLSDFSDLAAISPLAFDALLFSTSNAAVTPSASSLNPGPSAIGTTFSFSSAMTVSGGFINAGVGNYLVAAPASAFAVVSGPAGIFTAN